MKRCVLIAALLIASSPLGALPLLAQPVLLPGTDTVTQGLESPPIEVGQALVNHTWQTVALQQTFTTPIVVAKPASLKGSHPGVVRLRNVTQTSFQIRFQEWPYLDGVHTREAVTYVIVEQGHWDLPDGGAIEAGSRAFHNSKPGADPFVPVQFATPFPTTPVVLSTVGTFNGSDTVTTRHTDVTEDGFAVIMQEQEDRGGHVVETIYWLAWKPGSGTINSALSYEADTQTGVTHRFTTLDFFDVQASCLLADMQTYNGSDTANLRYRNLTDASVEVQVDEEQARDQETNHTRETVGYVALDCKPVSGLSFGPFVREGQDPTRGDTVSAAQLRELLTSLRSYTAWVRTFGSTGGLENAGRIAHSLGLQIACGAWLSRDRTANGQEIDALISNIKAGYCDMAIVGSEVLLRNDLSESELIAYLNQVKQEVVDIPVTTADVYTELLAHPNVIAASDIVLANIYPFWEGVEIENAVSALHGAYQQLLAAADGKEVIVSETGWPSCGDPIGDADPSPANASFYFLNFISWARANAARHFYFEAFDEPWKANAEGSLGACWGVFNKDGNLKAGMQDVFDGQTIPNNWGKPGPIGGTGEPLITFDFVPPIESFLNLRGHVEHVTAADHKVAVYIKVGGGWWTKPFFNAPLTEIRPNGTWTTDITTGGIDQQATHITAYLVPNGYQPPLMGGGPTLPEELDQNALTKVSVNRLLQNLPPIEDAVAMQVSEPIRGSLSSGVDLDLYQFPGIAGERALIQVVRRTSRRVFCLVLLAASTQQPVVGGEEVCGGAAQLDLTLPATDTYLVMVYEHGRQGGAYGLTWQRFQVGDAVALNVSEPVRGSLVTEGDHDLYQFPGIAGERALIQVVRRTSRRVFCLVLLAASTQQPVVGGEEVCGGAAQLDLTLPATDTYLVMVYEHGRQGGAYGLTWQRFQVGDAVALNVSEPVRGSLVTEGDHDLYQFLGEAGERALIQVVRRTSRRVFCLVLLAASTQQPVVGGEEVCGGAAQLDLTLPATDTYLVMVYEHGRQGGAYGLTWQRFQVGDAVALNVSEPVRGSLVTEGDHDLYQFPGIAGERALIQVVRRTSRRVFCLVLLAASTQQPVVGGEEVCGGAAQLDLTLPATDTYLVMVYEHGRQGGAYELLLQPPGA